MLNKDETRLVINDLTLNKEPFLFIIDFKSDRNIIQPLSKVDPSKILFDVQGKTNCPESLAVPKSISIKAKPIAFTEYQQSFNQIQGEIKMGNTYLANLTFQTPVATSNTLKEIFVGSKAKYKLWYDDQFVVFSPEIFVQISGDEIKSFPMKGTIDASSFDAENAILNNQKELAEHITIVDLIRNDMSIFADQVTVERFRYLDEVKTKNKTLLQVSSQIKGKLKPDTKIGDLIFSLLPAGSISGAPKNKTLEILDGVENYDRGFYTGVFGVFDGEKLDSGVMIRYIEKNGDQMVYKSGGGIHSLSDIKSEYQELIDKIYVPVH